MKSYPVEKSSTEEIELKVNETTFALVHKVKLTAPLGVKTGELYAYKTTIIMSKRGILNLYVALGEIIRSETNNKIDR